MTAAAKITVSTPISSPHGHYVSVHAECSECGYVMYTAGNPDCTWSHVLDDHLAQHAPGRALDITVDWEVSAVCSVCEDGIGDIEQEDDCLTCRDCGTSWDIDGTRGEKSES